MNHNFAIKIHTTSRHLQHFEKPYLLILVKNIKAKIKNVARFQCNILDGARPWVHFGGGIGKACLLGIQGMTVKVEVRHMEEKNAASVGKKHLFFKPQFGEACERLLSPTLHRQILHAHT